MSNNEETADPDQDGCPKGGKVLQITIKSLDFPFRLTEEDVYMVFGHFGEVTSVELENKNTSAKVTFSRAEDSVAAQAKLNGKSLDCSSQKPGSKGEISVTFVDDVCLKRGSRRKTRESFTRRNVVEEVPSELKDFVAAMPSKRATNGAQPQRASAPEAASFEPRPLQQIVGTPYISGKYTCRYEIPIENDDNFQVCRRIIGTKGVNMKLIVQYSGAKLRVRGKGSGFREGSENQESSDPLQLCVSAVTAQSYQLACELIEDLLTAVYYEYMEDCKKKGIKFDLDRLCLNRIEMKHQSFHRDLNSMFMTSSAPPVVFPDNFPMVMNPATPLYPAPDEEHAFYPKNSTFC